MFRINLALIAVILLPACACSPAFNGRWDGSGEIGEARFFKFSVQPDERKGVFTFDGQPSVDSVICDVVDQDGHVEFAIGTSGGSPQCSSLSGPLTFVGDFGRDVVTGMVLDRSSDASGRLVGLFRAFRVSR